MDRVYSVAVDYDGSIFMGGQRNSSDFVVMKLEIDMSYSVWTVRHLRLRQDCSSTYLAMDFKRFSPWSRGLDLGLSLIEYTRVRRWSGRILCILCM